MVVTEALLILWIFIFVVTNAAVVSTDEEEEILELERGAVSYHFSMLNDQGRNEAFHNALRKVITPKSRVLDVGAGTTLLSMMASRLGAESVVAVEKNSIMAEIGEEILELNDFPRNKIRIFSGQSYDLNVGGRLMPQPANVYVTETLDSWVIGEGILVALHDAKSRGLLTKDAIVIPNRATLYCQLVETIYSIAPIPAMVEGFNLEPMRRMRKQDDNFVVELTEHVVRKNLSDVFPVFDFSFQDFDMQTGLFNYTLMNLPIKATGNFHAVAFWFDCALDAEGEIRLTNRPLGGTHWMQMVRFMNEDELVEEGDMYKLQIAHTGEKFIIGSAQGRRRFVRIVSSCPADVEIFLTSEGSDSSADNEEYITTLPAVADEFDRQHNVFHGDVGDTFKAYIPTSREYVLSQKRGKKSGSSVSGSNRGEGSFHVHQQFTVPEDERQVERDEEGDMLLHEFHVSCNKLVLASSRMHDINLL